MKRLSVKSLAALALPLAMLAAPAHAQFIDRGEQTGRALLGSGLGALAGTAIAGNSSNTEGAIAGALIGGVLGAATTPRRGFAQRGFVQPGFQGGFVQPGFQGGFVQPGFVQSGFAQSNFVQPGFAPVVSQPVIQSPVVGSPQFLGYAPGRSFSQSYTTFVQPAQTVTALPSYCAPRW